MNTFENALSQGKAVKIIAGIANFDVPHVLAVARAAKAGGAQAVDVAADATIVRAVKAETDLVIFASATSVSALEAAVAAGADVAELGNYDALYAQGRFFGLNDVLALARETVSRLKGKAKISVTIPGHLSTDSQVALAQALEALGVDLIQTEGAARLLSDKAEVKLLTASEKSELTLRNTRALAGAVSLPVMTASGITPDNVQVALEAGAAAVGVGSFINELTADQEAGMAARVSALVAAIAADPSKAVAVTA